jgi:opacity protein-like surface antigen
VKRIFWFVLTVFLAVSDAHAQVGLSDLRLSVFGAGSFLAASRTFTTGGDIFNSKYESGPRIGVRATASLTDHMSFEGSYSYGRNNLLVTTMRSIPVMRLFETRTNQFSGNALYYFSGLGEDWKPFVTTGIGITRFSPTQESAAFAAVRFLDTPANLQATSKFGINLGGGTEYQITDLFGLRGDVRDHIMGIPRFNVPQSPTTPGNVFYPVSGSVNNLEFSAGVVFYLP